MTATIHTLTHLWMAVALHLWQSTLVLIALVALGWALRSAPARLQGALWWAALGKLFLPLALLGPLLGRAIRAVFPGFASTAATGALVRWGGLRGLLEPAIVVGPSSGGAISRSDWLCVALTVLWAAGAVWFVRLWLRGASRRVRDRHPLEVVAEPERSRFEAALRETGIPHESVLVSHRPGMPYVVGLLKPRIVLPEAMIRELAIDELRAVLSHEDGHRRRRDPLRNLPGRLALLVFYYFPPLWIVLRRLAESAELACDERALRAGVPPESFARALAAALRFGLDRAAPQPAMAGFRVSLLRRRFQRIREPWRIVVMPRHRIALFAAVAVVVLGSLFPIAPRAGDTPVLPELQDLAERDLPVRVRFVDQPLDRVLDAIAAAAGPLSIEYQGDPKAVTVSIDSGQALPLAEALSRLAFDTGISYEVPDPRTLIVTLPIPIDPSMTPPERVSKVEPVYPEAERAARIEGKVILEGVIGTDGVMRGVHVVRRVADHPAFDESAVNAVSQWRYLPATRAGKPVSVYFTVVVGYRLDREKKEAPAGP